MSATAAQRDLIQAALSATEGKSAYRLGQALPPAAVPGTLGVVTRPAPLTAVLSVLRALERQGLARCERRPQGNRWYLVPHSTGVAG